ncbi:MAG: GAF domain-containing sensor histidine kinase [Chloroflexi bacterium]|nr:GAF domain-containing sensor histidine kinase [Chloroflexota bacterium]MCC6891802.1 GAF domain-containing sensor histidine kinase [Anaerolineae bacterium]
MDSIFNAAIAISTGLYAVLLVYVQLHHRQLRVGRLWLSALLVLASLGDLLLIPQLQTSEFSFNRGFGEVIVLIGLIGVYGYIMLYDIRGKNRPAPRLWLAWSALWMIAFIAAGFATTPLDVSAEGWIIDAAKSPDASALILVIGFVLSALYLLGTALWSYSRRLLPEIANRVLFWLINCSTLLLACLLLMSGSSLFVALGIVTLIVGCSGAVYAATSYQVFDIRAGFNLAIRTTLLVGLTALIVFVALYITNNLEIPLNLDGTLLLIVIALLVGAVYLPLRKGVELIINPILKGTLPDSASITRQFSQQVSQDVELNALIKSATETLNKTLRVRRSGILLVNNTGEGKVELHLPQPSADKNEPQGILYLKSPIYQQLATNQAPVSQFELEYNPKYAEVLDVEREFFHGLQASAYAPIIIENKLTGILFCGAKLGDSPFYPRDLELLATLANQIGIALRNARLVADLRRLNENTERLNSGLASANQQMGKLDAVKTDFVTIASHELRTPLAQMRGYIDIMGALNEQGMLDQDRTTGMVDNLRKATERMEELIAAMLDVSQLDVDAMDLRFAPTTIETVVRMAIDPLTDAIKQRKLTLSARGLKGLPAIEADLQRLVQAFRNVVVNAIKFTPDKGRIELTASLQSAENANGEPSILVAITDTGVGISAENVELIFQKFYRGYDPGLHSTGTYKFMGAGPGLGLTIAQGVIEGHGGKIWAESPGNDPENFPGSTFYILIPIKSPETKRRVEMEGLTDVAAKKAVQ